jgi:AbrB family looped-hinge helix DNA binding protein
MQIEVVIDIILSYDKDIDMSAVTLSSKFQVVIPLDVRESMGLKPGIKLSVFRSGRTIQLVPVPTLAELQKELRGCGSDIPNEPDRF